MREDSLPDPSAELMRSIIKRIATGPELSKDISLEEAREGMRMVLDGQADPVQAAIFLIALRMKRETDDEVRGLLSAIREATVRVVAPVDEVLDLSDPYDGFARTLPASPFLPAVLAACGVAVISHGVETMGPKYGVTHRQVLRAAGVPVDLSPQEAAARLGQADIGWAYLDQSRFCPKLHALTDLRTRMVKRPALTTTEVLAGPVLGRLKTHLVTGYVHKPYPRVYAMLARHAGFDSALIVRGVEGGVVPSLRQTGKLFHFHDSSEEEAVEFMPADLGIEQGIRAPQIPGVAVEDAHDASRMDTVAVAQMAATEGRAALEGRPGPARDCLVIGAALCLWHLRRYATLVEAAQAVRAVLDSGAALKRVL